VPDPGMVDYGRVERPLFARCGNIVGPGKAVANDDGSD
jgi:hypothetical protein